MEVNLDVWGALGVQFLRLLVWAVFPEARDKSPYPLDSLGDVELCGLYANAAELLQSTPLSTSDGRVNCDVDAQSFFAFLHRSSVPVDFPICCFSEAELLLLVQKAWLPAGPTGERLKGRILQLVHATCSLRKACADWYDTPEAERFVWHLNELATDVDINDALCAYGLPPRDAPSQSSSPPSLHHSATGIRLITSVGCAADDTPPRFTRSKLPVASLASSDGVTLSPIVKYAVFVATASLSHGGTALQPASPPRLQLAAC